MNGKITPMKEPYTKDEGIRKILIALFKSNSPAPIGYISAHAGIKEPLGVLRKMEEMDLVSECTNNWSCCKGPLFEITSKAKKELFT